MSHVQHSHLFYRLVSCFFLFFLQCIMSLQRHTYKIPIFMNVINVQLVSVSDHRIVFSLFTLLLCWAIYNIYDWEMIVVCIQIFWSHLNIHRDIWLMNCNKFCGERRPPSAVFMHSEMKWIDFVHFWVNDVKRSAVGVY